MSGLGNRQPGIPCGGVAYHWCRGHVRAGRAAVCSYCGDWPRQQTIIVTDEALAGSLAAAMARVRARCPGLFVSLDPPRRAMPLLWQDEGDQA